MSTPGVGVLVALTYAAAIDDPARFRSSKAAGAHFGLTPKKYQSGETDVTGRISKIGDAERAHCALRGGQRHPDPAGQRFVAEELGDAAWPSAPACARRRWRWPGSSPWSCTGCWSTALSSSPARRPPKHRKGENHRFGRTRHQRPEQVPSPGRWIRSGRKSGSSSQDDCASLDWPTDPHQTPSGGGPRADPGQKQDTGDRITLKRD